MVGGESARSTSQTQIHFKPSFICIMNYCLYHESLHRAAKAPRMVGADKRAIDEALQTLTQTVAHDDAATRQLDAGVSIGALCVL
jgi:hypothetical protein